MTAAIATVALSAAVAVNPVPTTIEFWRSGGESGKSIVYTGRAPAELPQHHNVEETSSFMHGIVSTSRPPGVTTQWLSFKFYSDDLFTGNPNCHVAVALKWEGTKRWNRGHGIIFGRANRGAPADHPRAQIETWWQHEERAANFVGGPYGKPMQDLVSYSVGIHAADGGHVSYTIVNDETGETVASGYQYVGDVNPESVRLDTLKIDGIAFAIVFADGTGFSAFFSDIRTGWF